jgi:hypothetical protein
VELIFLNGLPIEIKKDKSNFWKKDLVLFCDPLGGKIKEEEILILMDYLYEEGFIQDRRTPYKIKKR